MKDITCTIVVDNQAAAGLVSEHGFAMLIETDDRTILFDTGNKSALLPNFKALGLDWQKLTDLILSHGHYDHAGGVGEVIARSGKGLNVYLHQAALQPRYKALENGTKSVRMPVEAMQSIGQLQEDSIHWLTRPHRISSDIGMTGPISRENSFEDTGGAFCYDQDGKRPDPIEDDNAVWLRTPSGLVICVGCSHAGIVNTLRHILEVTGESHIRAVIGGLHLNQASEERLRKTAAVLNTFDIGEMITCHCTGDQAVDYLQDNLQFPVISGYAGMVLKF